MFVSVRGDPTDEILVGYQVGTVGDILCTKFKLRATACLKKRTCSGKLCLSHTNIDSSSKLCLLWSRNTILFTPKDYQTLFPKTFCKNHNYKIIKW